MGVSQVGVDVVENEEDEYVEDVGACGGKA